MLATLADWIFTKDADKNKPVLSTFSGEYCLADIEIGMHSFISLLDQEGSLKGKKVAVLVPQIPKFIELFLAINQLGGIVIPLGWQLRQHDLSAVLQFLDPHIVFTIDENNNFPFQDFIMNWAEKTGKHTSVYSSRNGSHWVPLVHEGEERPLETEPMDIIACTSGSTGTPKGIMYNLDYVFDNVQRIKTGLSLTKTDRLFLNNNPSQIYGILILFLSLKIQCHTITPDSFDVPKIVKMIKNHQPTKVSSTPSLFRTIYTFVDKMSGLESLNQLQLCYVAGEMIPDNYVDHFAKLPQCLFSSGYGSSETGHMMNTVKDLREGIEWKPYETVNYKLIDGELALKVPTMFMGYYKRPDLTNDVLDQDGWYRSGDLANINKNNNIIILGRKKDLIKRGGLSLIPGEVEHLLLSHPRLEKVILVGTPHPTFGEKVFAFTVTNGDVTQQELKLYCSERIASYKVPDQFVFIDEIPTNNGKVDRLTLRKIAKSL